MERLTQIFKALADRNRLRVFAALLRHDELCACQITELLGVSGATVSRHMGVLIAAGLVDSRKDGRWVYYRLDKQFSDSGTLIEWIQEQLKYDEDVKNDLKFLDGITACEPEELCRRQRGDACCVENR